MVWPDYSFIRRSGSSNSTGIMPSANSLLLNNTTQECASADVRHPELRVLKSSNAESQVYSDSGDRSRHSSSKTYTGHSGRSSEVHQKPNSREDTAGMAAIRFTRSNARRGYETDHFTQEQTLFHQNKKLLQDIQSLRQVNQTLKSDNRQFRRNQQAAEELHEQYNDIVQERKRLYQEITQVNKERAALRDWYDPVVQKLLTPYLRVYGKEITKDSTGQTKLETVVNHIIGTLTEVVDMRARLGSLQKAMLANVDRIQSVPDEQFAQEFRILASTIKSMTRSNISPDQLENSVWQYKKYLLIEDVEARHWKARPHKKFRIEAAIWSILLDMLFCNPFGFLGESSKDFCSMWKTLAGHQELTTWPKPDSAGESWRFNTVQYVLAKISPGGINAEVGSHDVYCHPLLAFAVQECKQTLNASIRRAIECLGATADDVKIQAIVDKAHTLAIDMANQRNRLQVVAPSIGSTYIQGQTTEMLTTPNSEEIIEGEVAFVVNPGLKKWGDAHGKNLNQWMSLVPALVHIEEKGNEVGTDAELKEDFKIAENEKIKEKFIDKEGKQVKDEKGQENKQVGDMEVEDVELGNMKIEDIQAGNIKIEDIKVEDKAEIKIEDEKVDDSTMEMEEEKEAPNKVEVKSEQREAQPQDHSPSGYESEGYREEQLAPMEIDDTPEPGSVQAPIALN